MNAANYGGSSVVPFALRDRWIVTVECERQLVNVRHYTRWYAVARRKGYEDRRHWCASRADAVVIAGWQREAFARMAELERFEAMYKRLTAAQRAQLRGSRESAQTSD